MSRAAVAQWLPTDSQVTTGRASEHNILCASQKQPCKVASTVRRGGGACANQTAINRAEVKHILFVNNLLQ